MSSPPGRYFILSLLYLAIVLPLRAEEPTSARLPSSAKTDGSQKKSGTTVDNKKTVELKKADLSSLPGDAVIVICERADEALELVPKAVILRPDKYQELIDQIEKLKRQIENQKNENALPPTRCVLRGKIDASVARLEAEFSGTVEHADTLVSLACPQAGATAAETDGRMAQIRRSNTGGFLVRIDKAGEYHVKLDLLVPLSGREGNNRGFELTLPRAVITQLELALPSNCKDVRLGGQLIRDLQLPGLELKNNHLRGNPGLGPVDKLELSWKEARPSTGEPLRTVEGRIQARLDASGLTTEADLWLAVEGTPAKFWRLLVPRNAEIRVIPSDKQAHIEHRIDTDDSKYPFASLRTIHLKEARSEPLHVQIKPPRLPLPQRGSIMSIGPFFVFDAARQTGTIMVRNQVSNLHLDYRGRGEMQLRHQETEENRGELPVTVTTLVYGSVPRIDEPTAPAGTKSLSWLDLEAVRLPTQVRMRVSHTLALRPAPVPIDSQRGVSAPRMNSRGEAAIRPGGGTLQWEILTVITPVTKWADVDQLKVVVPSEWEPADENVSVVPNSNPRSVVVPSSLLREGPTQPQRLIGRYKLSCPVDERIILKLPQPQGIIESCEVKIEAPSDVEVVVNDPDQFNLELSRQPRPNEQLWRCRSLPSQELAIEVSWRPYRPELRVASIIDLTLNGNRGDVVHEMRLQLPPTPLSSVTLRVPAEIADSLQIQDDQGLGMRPIKTEIRNPKSAEKESGVSDFGYRVPITPKEGGKEWRLVLHYTTRLEEKDQAPGSGRLFTVPLAALEQATAGDVKVRIWSEASSLPRAANQHWEEQKIEEVKDRPLPILVLRALKLNAPLRLAVVEQAVGFSALVERSLMRVHLEESGAQRWKAFFTIRQIAERNLDLLLPAPVDTLKAQFSFNGHKVTPLVVNDKGDNNSGGNIAHLRLPHLYSQTGTRGDAEGGLAMAQLEVSFEVSPSRSTSGPLHSTLQPPQILRAAPAPTCWQVSVPPNRVLLAPESSPGVERVWTRRGWLLADSLLVPPELRRDDDPVTLLCWQDQGTPIVLTHVPQLGWLLVCSLGLLIAGLAPYWSARPQLNERSRLALWFWPLAVTAILAIAVASLFWPATLCAVAYGCEPGAAVLLAVLGVQWLMHQRYRRQIVFLPSFSRGRPDSSLIRKSPSHRPQTTEPSTVDAPPFQEDKVQG